jgi:hypothetical protein
MIKNPLGSRLKTKRLGWFLSHLDGSFFIRQGEQPIDEDSKNINRELKRLEQMGIVQSEKRSNFRCNQVNKKCPFLES